MGSFINAIRQRSATLLAPALAAGVLVGLGAGEAHARDFTVVSWGGAYQDAQRQIYFEPFAAEAGLRLLEDVWNGGVGAIRAKVEGGASDWDVVQVETEELVIGCEEGLYEPIDWGRIGVGEADLIPGAHHECGVGTIVWSTVLAYDGDRIAEGPKGWADFFDTARFPGKRGLRRGPQYALEFALIADGVPVEEVYPVLATAEGVDRAFARLDAIKGDIVWWEAGAQPPQLLAAGEVVMTSAYNGRISARQRHRRAQLPHRVAGQPLLHRLLGGPRRLTPRRHRPRLHPLRHRARAPGPPAGVHRLRGYPSGRGGCDPRRAARRAPYCPREPRRRGGARHHLLGGPFGAPDRALQRLGRAVGIAGPEAPSAGIRRAGGARSRREA
jgi:hypothetical protein